MGSRRAALPSQAVVAKFSIFLQLMEEMVVVVMMMLVFSLVCVCGETSKAASLGVEGTRGVLHTLRGGIGSHLSQIHKYEITTPVRMHADGSKSLVQRAETYPREASFRLRVEGKSLLLNVERNSELFTRHYTETHYSDNGTLIEESPNYADHCYYHGQVDGHADSAVSLSTCSGLRGFVTLGQVTYAIEPLEGAGDGRHRIYRADLLLAHGRTCGHDLLNETHARHKLPVLPPVDSHGHARLKRSALKNMKYVELIIVADNAKYNRENKDLTRTKQRMIDVANHVDKYYRSLNIRIALVGVEVWTDSDKSAVTVDASSTLYEFLDWRKKQLLTRKKHDNAQLVTGISFQGTTIGMAPLMSMCSAEQSGGVNMDHAVNPVGLAATMAHEMGHNFGMNHDTPERRCHCQANSEQGGCIMAPSTGHPFPSKFSSCSTRDLDSSLSKGGGMCLYNMPDVRDLYGGKRCGNGYVEDGEQCDCGEIEECDNPCCNANNCTLRAGAECAHGMCCQDCQLKPSGTRCRDPTNTCDLPEYCNGGSPHCPPNVYLLDGYPCHGKEAYCYNGMCLTHEQQCVTLWGSGSKPAPEICFANVNSAGDQYGNCGKDSKAVYMKCKASDVKCGKIQCQGGSARPVIGTNAVSIDTNIAVPGGGTVLCRGTHVYLGDDMLDPGLVLTGTKCGEGKICYNRHCQNVSILKTGNCDTKCNGHGVCNSNRNCHCDGQWAPPACEQPGHGGSIDSGPIRPSRECELMVALMVTFFLILPSLGLAMYICYRKRTTLWQQYQTRKEHFFHMCREGRGRSGKDGGQTNPGYDNQVAASKRTHMVTVHHEDIQMLENNPRTCPPALRGPLPLSGQARKQASNAPPRPQGPGGPPRPCVPLAKTGNHHQAVASPAVPRPPAKPLPSGPQTRLVEVTQSSPKPLPPRKPLPVHPCRSPVPTAQAKNLSPNMAALAARFSPAAEARPVRPAPGKPDKAKSPKPNVPPYLLRK
ncbi:disintegrin and metalloproteinase domain-containing protein 12-like [Lampetra planeri]